MNLRQSAAWWCFSPLLEPLTLVKAAAEIGYAGLDFVPEIHWPLVRDHGLIVSCMQGHRSLEHGLNDPLNHDRIARELEDSIRLAERSGIPNLVCFSGSRYGPSDTEGALVTAAGFNRVAKIAEDAGVTLVLELLNSRVDHPKYQADHTAWGSEVCRLVDSSRVKLLYDIYHMQIMEGDLIRTITAHHASIGHYHTAGNPGRNEISDPEQEIAYPAITRAIQSTGFQGFVCHEFVPRGNPIKALESAFSIGQGV